MITSHDQDALPGGAQVVQQWMVTCSVLAGLDAQDDDIDMELDGYDDFSDDDAGNAMTYNTVQHVRKNQLHIHAFCTSLDHQFYCLTVTAS